MSTHTKNILTSRQTSFAEKAVETYLIVQSFYANCQTSPLPQLMLNNTRVTPYKGVISVYNYEQLFTVLFTFCYRIY